jgi:hypothetical protein
MNSPEIAAPEGSGDIWTWLGLDPNAFIRVQLTRTVESQVHHPWRLRNWHPILSFALARMT